MSVKIVRFVSLFVLGGVVLRSLGTTARFIYFGLPKNQYAQELLLGGLATLIAFLLGLSHENNSETLRSYRWYLWAGILTHAGLLFLPW